MAFSRGLIKQMLKKLLPETLDNHYKGHAIAKWIFLAITILTLIRSLIHMFFADGGAQSIATIPLNIFTPNGAATVILLMALWGLSQFLMGLVYLVVFFRYQTLIPFMYFLIFIEYAGRLILMFLKPIHITGTAPGGVINYFIIPLSLLMLFLSLKTNNNISKG
jgi:hypothetical protein